MSASFEPTSADPQALVREFHATYGLMIGDSPALPDAQTRELRKSLIQEEVVEYLDEEAVDNLPRIASELADIVYVVFGAAISYGIDLNAVLSEIHRANMSKLDDNGQPIYREDGKVLKGPNYVAPDIEAVLRNQNR